MRTVQTRYSDPKTRVAQERGDHAGLGLIASCLIAAFLALVAFYCSLIASSAPVRPEDRAAVNRAIKILEDKGFDREVFLLRHTAAFRGSDNWLNNLTKQDNAYAATNFPFQIVTLYTDFYQKAKDDTERAMVLLHEAQHLKGKDEHDAYAYVWQNRARLGWTQISYGTTPSYITIEEQTRENAPELFTCQQKLWNDCTETLRARK